MDVYVSNGTSNLKGTNMKTNNQPTSSNATRTKQPKQALMSNMSQADKKFFRQLLDILKRYHCQREALFQILHETTKNWEPVYRVLQGELEIVQKADQTQHLPLRTQAQHLLPQQQLRKTVWFWRT
jgi:hypothetical protein